MEQWTIQEILQAGGFIAIMLAVLGVPQLLSSYFDLRARRLDRLENEANAERRHQEMIEENREERREERRREEERRRQEEERRREERTQEEERRREERTQEEERRRDDERRHQELMTLIVAAMNNGRNQNDAQNELIRTLQQTVADLQAENARLRQRNGNGNSDISS